MPKVAIFCICEQNINEAIFSYPFHHLVEETQTVKIALDVWLKGWNRLLLQLPLILICVLCYEQLVLSSYYLNILTEKIHYKIKVMILEMRLRM